jgi:hypothetical protein
MPDCRPLVGPGNTNQALEGPWRRSDSLKMIACDMEKNTLDNKKTP